MVRYYGFYSNVSRGKRKKQDQDGMIPSILDPDGTSKEYRRNWALITVDPEAFPDAHVIKALPQFSWTGVTNTMSWPSRSENSGYQTTITKLNEADIKNEAS